MTDNRPVAVPSDLEPAGQKLWADVHSEWGLAAHEEVILVEACRCKDRLDRVNRDLSKSRLTETRRDKLLREARAQQAMLARLIASLRLPDDDSGHRPQRRGGARGTYRAGRTGS